MSAEPSLISELDEGLKCSASSKRVEVLRRVTDLFLINSDAFEVHHIELFDDVLGRMIEHIESKALAELGQRLAPVANAPTGVIRRLAMHDEIVVAGPVLTTSNRLTTTDLVAIAAEKGQGHLLAIAGRNQIDTQVTDILVERGDTEVARKVAVNSGARFSSGGYATLVTRAEHDDTLAEGIGRRADIPPKLFKVLLEKATETVRARLKEHLPAELANGAMQKLRSIASELAPKVPTRNYTSAQFLTKLMHQENKLGEKEIHEFVRGNRFEEAVAALALRASTQIDIIERLMDGGHIEALLIPCKAAGLTWPTVRSLMQLHACHSTTSEEKFGTMRRDFLKLSASAAQRILRFWQVRSTKDGMSAN